MNKPELQKARTILVADDEQWYADGLVYALEFEGYRVVRASTGSAVLTAVQSLEDRPDLVILDVMMNPGDPTNPNADGRRTGLNVMREIREKLGLAASVLPVICLTVVRDEQLRSSMVRLGAEFLSKETVTLDEIIGKIRSRFQAS